MIALRGGRKGSIFITLLGRWSYRSDSVVRQSTYHLGELVLLWSINLGDMEATAGVSQRDTSNVRHIFVLIVLGGMDRQVISASLIRLSSTIRLWLRGPISSRFSQKTTEELVFSARLATVLSEVSLFPAIFSYVLQKTQRSVFSYF